MGEGGREGGGKGQIEILFARTFLSQERGSGDLPLLVSLAVKSWQYGRVSTISSGSIPAIGLPTRLRTLSMPACSEKMPAPRSAFLAKHLKSQCSRRISM